MHIELRIKIVTAVILVIVTSAAIVPYRLTTSIRTTMSTLRVEVANTRQFERLMDALQDAETGQRGFLITGDEKYLEPYILANGRLSEIRQALLEYSGNTPEEKRAIVAIVELSERKMDEMAQTITLRRQGRRPEAEAIVRTGRGKNYMSDVRVQIGKQVESSLNRSNNLRKELEHTSDYAAYACIGFAAASLVIVSLMTMAMLRALRQSQSAAGQLRMASEQLQCSNAEMRLSAEMLQALASVATLGESTQVIATYCSKLFGNLPGSLYLYNNSRDLLEQQASWGTPASTTGNFDPADCWALQRGHHHLTRTAEDLCCAHYMQETMAPDIRLCTPLVTQGDVIGLLYLEGLANEEGIRKVQTHLADRVAEQIALALANVRLRETLRRQSIVDPLTGLFNRRYMDETLKRELRRAERKLLPLALVVMDLDHFKNINDSFGHDAGDTLLKAVAQAVQMNIRDSDLACRLGGEEFVLILSECGLEPALKRTEIIRASIEALQVQHGNLSLGTVTASFGVAIYPDHGTDPDRLINMADQAMYQAKQGGRNQVRIPVAV